MHALHKLLVLHVLTCLGQNALGAKIINGVKVPENLMLYMASLQNNIGVHVCGGFLIREDFVLTAAHCYNHRPVKVVLGTHSLRNPGTVRNIVRKCKHPRYRQVETGSDIMLLKLSPNVTVDRRIQTIVLPPAYMNVKDNQLCHVAGWGVTETGRGVTDLRVAGVSVVNQNVCRRQWSHSKSMPHLLANVICAGGTFKRACYGDSGGPLVCNEMAAGVVSYGDPNCTDPNLPDFYTDVSKFRPWINDIVNGRIRC